MTTFYKQWEKYGLKIAPIDDRTSMVDFLEKRYDAHDLLCVYLMNHPEIEEKYLKKYDGYGYYNIISLAEKKYKFKLLASGDIKWEENNKTKGAV